MPSGYELVVKIGADTSDVRKGLKKTGQQVDNFDKKVKKAGAGFKGTTSGMLLDIKRLRADLGALTFAAGALTGAIGLVTKSQVDAFRETRRWAKMLDISETSLSSLTVVGKRFNVSLDDVASGMSDMSLKITDAANGAKPFEEILNKIGLNSADLIKLKPDQQFLKLADAISAADSELKKFALDELGSDPLLRMIGMLDQGSDGLKAMVKDVEALGQSMSAADFEQMSSLSESLTEANIKLDATSKVFVNKIGPAIVAMIDLTDQMIRGWSTMVDAILGDEMENLTARADKLAGIIAQVKDELDATKAGKKWFVNVEDETKRVTKQLAMLQLQAEKVNNRIAELSAKSSPDAPGESADGGGTFQADAEAKAREIGLQARADALQVYAANELIAKAEHDKMMAEATELGLIAEADARQVYAANAIIAKAEQYALELEANKGFWASMFEVDKKAGKANADLWASGWGGKMDVMSDFMGQMSVLMKTNSRKQFEIGKAAAIAQVAIDTPKAAMSAYSAMAGIPIVGPALGVAAAGAAIASGVAQMQNIKSQSMGGGSNASAGGIQAASGGAGDAQGGGSIANSKTVLNWEL